MSNISNQLPSSGYLPRQTNLPAYQSASYTDEQTINYSENLDAGLTLQTKEGDTVTLTAGNYTQLNAYQYTSSGRIQSDQGTASYSMRHQEITLASGQSFSFSVNGELSESEIDEIKDLLTDLDAVISEVKQGNIEDALGYALEMGNDSETISSFSASVKYTWTYQTESSQSAQIMEKGHGGNSNSDHAESTITDVADQSKSRGRKYGHFDGFEKFLQKMTDHLEKHDSQLLGFANAPINKLLHQHLEEASASSEQNYGFAGMLQDMMNRMNAFFENSAINSTSTTGQEPVIAED